MSMRCAVTSRTVQAPATVPRFHSSADRPRSSETSADDTGRKNGRVSTIGSGESGIPAEMTLSGGWTHEREHHRVLLNTVKQQALTEDAFAQCARLFGDTHAPVIVDRDYDLDAGEVCVLERPIAHPQHGSCRNAASRCR